VIPTVDEVLKRSPGYDIRRIFSTPDAVVMRQLIKKMSTSEQFLFRAIEFVPMPLTKRKALGELIKESFGNLEDHLYSLIIVDGKIAVLVCPQRAPPHIDDLLLLLNFVDCLNRSQEGEVWAPLCLPKFNNTGYLWCYSNNVSVAARVGGSPHSAIDKNRGVLLVQLATSQEAFLALSHSANAVVKSLKSSSPVSVCDLECWSQQRPKIDICGDGLELQWFAYITKSQQLFACALPALISRSKARRKLVLRQAVKLRDKLGVLTRATTPLLIATTDLVTLCIQKDKSGGELVCVFLPCTPKSAVSESARQILKEVSQKDSVWGMPKYYYWS
jgi:hypothetical protein